MTRFAIVLTVLTLSVTLVSAAHAYETDPSPEMLQELSQISFVAENTTQTAGVCTLNVTPEIAAMLALDADWRTGGDATLTAIACVGDQ